MFARVTRIRFEGNLEEGLRNLRERVIPAARQLTGCLDGYWLFDSSTGDGMAITLWADAATLRDSEASADQIRSRSTQAVGSVPVKVERYEVIGKLRSD